jgi:Putative cyclase
VTIERSGAASAVRDLTHTFRQEFPVGGYDSPRREEIACFGRDGFRSNAWSLVEHTATHVDAPSHFFPGGLDVSELSPEDLIVSIAVIDIADRAAAEPNTAVTVADVPRYEREHGTLPVGAAVFMCSGWDSRAGDARFVSRPRLGRGQTISGIYRRDGGLAYRTSHDCLHRSGLAEYRSRLDDRLPGSPSVVESGTLRCRRSRPTFINTRCGRYRVHRCHPA